MDLGSVSVPMDDEARLMEVLSSTEASVLTTIPLDPDLDALWGQLSLCLRVHKKAEDVVLKLRPLIGRFLLAARDNPAVYQTHGFATYSIFIDEYVCGLMGLSRSALYEARMIAERLPTLTPEQYKELGPTKAMTLAKYTRSTDPSFEKYREEAINRTAKGFIQWSEEQNLLTKGEQEPRVLVIHADRLLVEMWEEFIRLAEVQSFVGSASPTAILKAMIAECKTTWVEYERVED